MTKIKQMTRKHAAKNRRNADVDAQHGSDVQKPLDSKENYIKYYDQLIYLIQFTHLLFFSVCTLRLRRIILLSLPL